MKSLSISNRINLGFSVLILLLAGVAGMSYLAVDALGDSYKRYRATAKQTIVISNFVEDLFQARVAALKYRSAPSGANKDAVTNNIEEIIRDTENFLKTDVDNTTRNELTEISLLATGYRDDFLRFSDTTARVNELDQVLLSRGKDARLDLTKLEKIAVDGQDITLLGSQSLAQESLLLGRIYAEEYIASEADEAYETSLGHFKTAQSHLSEASAHLRGLGAAAWKGEAEALIDDAHNILIELEKLLTDARENVRQVATIRDGSLDQVGPQMQDRLETWAEAVVALQDQLGPEGQAVVDRTLRAEPIVSAIAFLVAIVTAFIVGRWITNPLSKLATATSELAQGNIDIAIEGADQQHQLGEMARALEVFRTEHIARDRIINEREEKVRSEQLSMVKKLSDALQSLAAGHLDTRVQGALADDYEELRTNFNKAVSQLETTLSGVISTSCAIESSADTINDASQDLSRRTENQAATLEETAAALDELTESVRSSADRAKQVATTVSATRSDAKESGQVVDQAVGAMEKIENSSQQISQITEVIQDIAFQTNLLALNAGVEAARAGEAGRGFAVVASEVRALAQRSSQAAREVSDLISTSSSLVSEGTTLVNNAGNTLGTFVEKVDHIADLIAEIASNATQQASSISEINTGVGQLDQVTQQNAGMVEASHRQGEDMVAQAKKLDQLVSAFRLSETAARQDLTLKTAEVIAIASQEPESTPSQQPVRRKVVGSEQDTWEDF